ncbi:hypothetical protein [Phocoenobacter skyensis]|uniref:Uncharacterized protein n=1 Tax=Phocoenobacter skyensis TaxID=97481 RepID=A0A1H7X7Q2_9PAST|nr:hypothetical protein [Pasteurella skyensis]MDP8079610.1 hypothetical protein [Pasteurella skyensis]MDP8085559.1 hypothetical protein [Pasteurella skyensis]MDP8185613.1 hypothetical protein [Pasteurella skyensis]QLB21930.1 hypothetical protein A6B44_01410 [Pasteurella skyensis]SEM29168.1 hypothetical protein SAMN05444853_11148 [Pasteurella skyensis]
MLKQIKYCIVILSIFCSQMSFATAITDVNQLGQKMMSFYQNPQQQRFDEIQQGMMALYGKTTKIPIMVVWANAVSQKYGWKINQDFYPELVKQLRNSQSEFSQFVANDEIVVSMKLDIWWSSFFATGEDKYVRKIFDQAIKFKEVKQYLDNKKTQTNQDAFYLMTLFSADWSFKANCKHHKKIRTFAHKWQREKSLTTEAKQLLATCINSN